MDIDQIRENIRVLQDDILHLEERERKAPEGSLEAESIERIINVKWRLLSEQREKLDHLESRMDREMAEIRLRHHDELDTLDLY